MDDVSDLTGLATATSFLWTVVMTTFGLTDVLCGSSGGLAELGVAALSAVTFAAFLTRPNSA